MSSWLKDTINGMVENIGSSNTATRSSDGNTGPKPLDYSRKISMRDWLRTVSNCRFSYAYDETGIAVDTVNRSVILIQHINRRPVTKTYSFDQIREWSYEIPGAQRIYNNAKGMAAMQTMALNIRFKKEAELNTGFKVAVRDIDYPEWFIKFESTKTVSTDLKRWMEIFNQCVNEAAQIAPVASPNKCPACGTLITEPAKFCAACGAAINPGS